MRKLGGGSAWTPERAYDLFADSIESWPWYGLWQACERPHVLKWLSRRRAPRGLDAGCGTAPYIEAALDACAHYTGIDISRGMLSVARSHADRLGARRRCSFIQTDLESMPFRSAAFDWLLCTRAVSHVAALHRSVAAMSDALKATGTLCLTDVHPLHPYDQTRIAVRDRSVYVETYKHPCDKLLALLEQSGLVIDRFMEIRLNDLDVAPDPAVFGKLYDFDNPYLLILVEATKL